MGRSAASCLKIITCGGGGSTTDKDDLEAAETKGDKRGWTFRKRSARHRVLSNTAISESSPPPPPPAIKKEAPDSAADVSIEEPAKTEVPKKVPCQQFDDEKPQLLDSVESKQSDPDPVVDEKPETVPDFEMDESAVISIQSAARVLLAQRELLKLKNVIKLQAAVRGHLVRKHAVGTLRCVQAIVKMQALVRARRARVLAESSVAENTKEDAPTSKASDDANARNKPSDSYVSIEKLLSNRFARQLLESTPKEKPIDIKCDMSTSNSAWKWLERWMSASTAEPSPNTDVTTEPPKSDTEDTFVPHEETKTPPEDSTPTTTSESNENVMTYEEDKIKFEEMRENVVSPVVEEITEPAQPQLEDLRVFNESLSTEMDTEKSKRSMKRSASEELEAEGKKSASGSRKSTNPDFTVAKSESKELAPATESNGSIDSFDESKLDIAISREENSAHDEMAIEPECKPELSISSTLGSHLKDENNAKDHEEGSKVKSDSTIIPEPMVSDSALDHPEKNSDDVTTEPMSSIMSAEVVQQENIPSPELQKEVNSETVDQVHVGSPEASPRTHITVQESQETPSSQVSVNTKGSKVNKTGSNSVSKRKSLSKKSPTSPYSDSGPGQSGIEQKSNKRRSSLGSARAESDGQEPRESSSSNSIPRFMQATESAKAKVQANSSPRSSPDVSDREGFLKKRNSLPGSNGRQGSPRIQRSLSQQAQQQGGKANGGPTQERKWLR